VNTLPGSKTCPQCFRDFDRPKNSSRAQWANRKFCSMPCSAAHQCRHDAPPAGDVQWRDQAACAGVDEVFVPDHTDPTRMQPLADKFCHSCPALTSCGGYADEQRAAGLWGGVFRHRAAETGRYRWHTLVAGAPNPQLTAQRTKATRGAA